MTRLHFQPLMSMPEALARIELAHELHSDVERTKKAYRTAPVGQKLARRADWHKAVARLAAERRGW